MKILIIGFGKLKYMPYLNIYTKVIKEKIKSGRFDLYYWDRDKSDDISAPNLFTKIIKYNGSVTEKSLLKKIPHFLRFRNRLIRLLKYEKYDRLIILHSTPGLLILDYLKRKKINYLLDYRDFSHENNFIYRRLVNMLFKYSAISFVSSEGFKTYLDKKNNYNIIHNLPEDTVVVNKKDSFDRKKIVLRFWGLIRHFEINKGLINRIAEDSRFELHYHGREQNDAIKLKNYCKEINVQNVFFHGEYFPHEIASFCTETNIVINIYDNKKRMKYAVSNKYYDSLLYKIPQLCTFGSYMGKRVEDRKIGISLNVFDDEFTDHLYRYYSELDFDVFNQMCELELTRILKEQDIAKKLIYNYLEGEDIKYVKQ